MCGGGGSCRQALCVFAHTLMAEMTLSLQGPQHACAISEFHTRLLHSEHSFYFSVARPHKELSPNLFTALYCLKSNGAHTSR